MTNLNETVGSMGKIQDVTGWAIKLMNEEEVEESRRPGKSMPQAGRYSVTDAALKR